MTDPQTPATEALEAALERERDLRDALLEASYYHVTHDGTPRHPTTCSECRMLAESRRSVESPQ
jgi:hypothetical protein